MRLFWRAVTFAPSASCTLTPETSIHDALFPVAYDEGDATAFKVIELDHGRYCGSLAIQSGQFMVAL